MKILVDLIHPANYHYFKNFISEMENSNHEVYVTARDKDVLYDLLKKSGRKFSPMGRPLPGFIGKVLFTFFAELRFLLYSCNLKPDLFISFSSSYVAHTSFLVNRPHITFDDTEHAHLNRKLYAPFTDYIFTPSSFNLELGDKHIKFNGNMELAYLHEEIFKPDIRIYDDLGIDAGTQYIIIRLVSWDAAHDLGQNGITMKMLSSLLKFLSKDYKIFISSESPLPFKFRQYKLPVSPQKIHNVLYYSSLYIGEGATMASESAILGTPSIYVNTLTAGTIDEQEKFGLLFRAFNNKTLFESLKKILEIGLLSKQWASRKKFYLESKVNLTEYLVNFVNKEYVNG